jgi:hypothetical protein
MKNNNLKINNSFSPKNCINVAKSNSKIKSMTKINSNTLIKIINSQRNGQTKNNPINSLSGIKT